MAYQIIWEEGGAYMKMSGILTSYDLSMSSQEVFHPGKLSSLDYIIWDGRDIQNVAIDEHMAVEIAANDALVTQGGEKSLSKPP